MSLVIRLYHEKNEKLTSRTVSAQLPTDQAWSLVRLRVSISLFFPPVSDFEQRGGGREGLTGIARYGVLRVIGLLGKRMLRRVATMVEIASSREILPGPGGKKENSRQTSFSPLALSAKRTPTPTTCLAVTNNSSFQKCLHQDTQNHGAGTTAKRRIRKGVDADARPGVGAGRTGGLTCPCLRR